MPYGISQNQSDCAAWATVKQETDGSYTTIGCHQTKQDAIDHMVAASINTNTEVLGEVRAVNLAPPAYMRAAARRGLQLHAEGKSGDGVRLQTVEDARKMAAGTVTEEKWRKIAPWIARHMVDLDAIDGNEITAGLVAHLLWGSDGTREGATRAMKHAEQVVAQLDEDRAITIDMGDGAPMPESVEVEMPSEESADPEQLEVSAEVKVCIPTSWVVRSDGARSLAFSNLELRAKGDSNVLVGYAAVFDSPSEPLPWTEYVRRGAFSKTLKDGADVRLLIDHEGLPLARTKSGTLFLEEDEIGLRMEAPLDINNPDAARLLSALRRGDVSQMSFAFRTVKDAWNESRNVRELKEVQLYDVSVVTYPAYEETVAELRSRNSTESDTVQPIAGKMLRKRQIQLRQMQAER